jgi:hypothetical protein
MRRFSLGIIIVLLAGAFYGLASGNSEKSAKNGPAGNDAADTPAAIGHGGADIKSGTVTSADRRTRVAAEFEALEAVDKTAAPAIAQSNPPVHQLQAVAPTVEADSVDYADAHIPSSTNATEIGPALAKLSLIDLKMAAQQELARLGCYKARIDGLWGLRSQAAVQAFNQRVQGGFDENATAPLVKALRSAPDGLCERDCSAGAPGESCVIALSEDPNSSAVSRHNEGLSYLPPWMRGQKLASTEADAVMSEQQFSAAQSSEAAPPRARRASRNANPRERSVDTRRRRSANWLPSGWPGANR